MSISFTIFPERGLVYVRYEGFIDVEETAAAFADYARHPDRRPGQKQLVDLAAATGCDQNFARVMELQASKADVFLENGGQVLLVYYAPTRAAMDIAAIVRRSWEGLDSIVLRMVQTEEEALNVLGQPELSLDALMASAR